MEGQYLDERGNTHFDSEFGKTYMIIPGIVDETVYKRREWMEFVGKLEKRENLKRRKYLFRPPPVGADILLCQEIVSLFFMQKIYIL